MLLCSYNVAYMPMHASMLIKHNPALSSQCVYCIPVMVPKCSKITLLCPFLVAVTLGFENSTYTVEEDDIQLNDVIYITKDGLESEQVLRIVVQNPFSNSAIKGNYITLKLFFIT